MKRLHTNRQTDRLTWAFSIAFRIIDLENKFDHLNSKTIKCFLWRLMRDMKVATLQKNNNT